MTWEKLRSRMTALKEKVESRLPKKAKRGALWLEVYEQSGFSLTMFMENKAGKVDDETLGWGNTISKVFADAERSLLDGTLAKYLKKPKTSGSRGKKKHK